MSKIITEELKFRTLVPKYKSSLYNKLRSFDHSLLFKTWDILQKILKRVKNDFEIYDYVKEYVDVVQETDFCFFWKGIELSEQSDSKTNITDTMRQAVKQSLILERWAMFFIFYFYFNDKILKQHINEVKKLVQKVNENSGFILGIWGVWMSGVSDTASTKQLAANMVKIGEQSLSKSVTASINNKYIFEIFMANNKSIMDIFDTWYVIYD